MEVLSLINIGTSLVTILIIGWLCRMVNWLWLKPKRLERCLRQQGFRGRSYRFFFGDTRDIAAMVEEASSKPMEHISNDYISRVYPFQYQTIQNYGENSFVWHGPTPTIIVKAPEIIREILNKVYDFRRTGPNPLLKELTNGLTTLEGHKWAQDRKLINPAFHMEKLKHLLPAFSESCSDMIQEWRKMTSKTGSHEVEMWSSLYNLSADAISRAAFGSSFEEGKRVFELLREHIAITVHALQSVYIPGWRYLPTETNKRATKITKEIEVLLKDMIQRKQRAMEDGETSRDYLLGALLKSSIGNQGKIKLSLKEVFEECKLFYIAGQETTSSLLVWTLILLSKHREWQDKAREEIVTTFGNNIPDFDGLNKLKKVNMILYEVLRLYPPSTSLNRHASHDITVGGKLIPASVQINLPVLFVHHDEKYWGANAKEFDPERFSQGISKATGGNISFFSFGWGPRICIGSNFAMIEVKITLSMILQRFSLDLSPSYSHAPTVSLGTLRPQFGANLVLHAL